MNQQKRDDMEKMMRIGTPVIEKAQYEFYLRLYLEGTSQIEADLRYYDDENPSPEDDELDTIASNMIALMMKDLGME